MAAQPSFATLEYGKKEKRACTYCHVKTGEKEVNEAGKYYMDHDHSFKGYTPKK